MTMKISHRTYYASLAASLLLLLRNATAFSPPPPHWNERGLIVRLDALPKIGDDVVEGAKRFGKNLAATAIGAIVLYPLTSDQALRTMSPGSYENGYRFRAFYHSCGRPVKEPGLSDCTCILSGRTTSTQLCRVDDLDGGDASDGMKTR